MIVFFTVKVTGIEGKGAYSQLYLIEDVTSLVSKSLKEVYNLLPSQFYRPHDSHIINLNHVVEFKKQDGGFVLMVDNKSIPVSRRRRQGFIDALKHLSIEI